jgi:glucose-1-phosphatase
MTLSKNSVKVLLFDIGGVILDISFAKVLGSWSRAANVDTDELKTRFTFDSFYEQHERGEITASAYFATLRNSLAVSLTDEQFTKGWNAVALGEVSGIQSLLLEAKKSFRLYAFSNTNVTHLEYVMRHYADTLGLFEKLFTSCEMGKRKPTKEAFEMVTKEIGVPANEILFFDDLPQNVEGAREAGLQAVHVQSVEDTRKALEFLMN